MEKKPNVLFFFTDDQRFDTIHALGNPQISTPNMDKLVENGTAFTQAHIPCGTSGAVCMPSRAMLHTGRTLFHLLNEGQEIPENHVTLGEAFKMAGYRTFGAGKWHNGTSSYARSFTDGGAIFFGGMWDHWNVPYCDYDPAGKYDRRIPFTMNFMLNNSLSHVHCDRFSNGKHSSELISDTAIDFLDDYESDRPFFMYLSYLAPHDPRSMPQRFMDMYDPEKISLPDNFMEEHPFHYGVENIRDELLAPYPRTPDVARRHIAEYYAMITHLDYEIGRVMDVLRRKGLEEDTIVVLAGDNGLAVGQHGLMGKQNHYEHSIRVPLVLSGPGIAKGQTTYSYAYLLDLFPTLCDLSGMEIPPSVEGISLVPVLENPEHEVRETLYFAYNDLIRSVKDNRFKLIEYAGRIRTSQLFDLRQDPGETENLYNDKAYSEVVDQLRSRLRSYRDEWEDEQHRMGKKYWDAY
jgi:arylsulfatase A-like enzyme